MLKLFRSTTIALLLSALAVPGAAGAGVRKSVTSLTATEIASLRRGVAQMKAWNSAPKDSADYRRSWEYWANMHEYFGDGCEDASGLGNPGMTGLSQQTPTTPETNETWCKCEHGTTSFLTWHRMYLYFFEKVLQAAAGDANLQLPYWDYQADGHIPLIYRQALYGKAPFVRANPLYTANREPSLNDGSGALLPAVTSTTDAMKQPTFGLFSAYLEATPHGSVHCAVGFAGCQTGYMGSIPAAANDPIFWAHHSSIDRFYECWLRSGPNRLPTDASVLNAMFSFPDATGTVVTKRAGDMLTSQQLGYTYAGLCPGVIGRLAVQLIQRVPPWVKVIGPTRIDGGRPTIVPLRISGEARAAFQRLLAQPTKVQAVLRISGIRADRVPHALYRVAIRDRSGRVTVIGVLNFFNMTSRKAMMHEGGRGGLNQSFVLPSTEIAAHGGQLVFEPTSGVTGRRGNERVTRLDVGTLISFEDVAISFQ